MSVFALVAVAQLVAKDERWARALEVESFRRWLAWLIIGLEDNPSAVLVEAARMARKRRDGPSLVTVLRGWLGFAENGSETARLLALDRVLGKDLKTVEAANAPLVYMRATVRREAWRIEQELEAGGRAWGRIRFAGLSPHCCHPDVERDDVQPEERRIGGQTFAVQARARAGGRLRPALARLLDVADDLRAGGVSGSERRLLELVEHGIPPAEAERLAACGHSTYVNLLQKARRLVRGRATG